LRIEDYALVGDTQTAALIGRDGSIDWAPFPRFDSGACFAALLGDRENGRWLIGPAAPATRIRRRYLPGTLVLETIFETAAGVVRLTDFMPVRGHAPDIVRIIEGIRGEVAMRFDLVIRFDYGRVVPWVRRPDGALIAAAGPDALCLRGDLEVHGEELATVGSFTIAAGERRAVICTWFPSHEALPEPVDPIVALAETREWWQEWSGRCRYDGPYREAVTSSLMVLKALTYGPTGGIVAAATTSLPEWPGGVRNWDYRYCWLRDSTFTLHAFMSAGYSAEAEAWREWLLRAVAGDPDRLQIMYGLAGQRRLEEYEIPWLSGYEGSRPVRVGNQAHDQFQLDVYGEVLDSLFEARRFEIGPDAWAWGLERALLDSLEARWREPDCGIWEVRGPRRPFTHSRVMAWVAFDRAIKTVEGFGMEGPVDRWRALRQEIHAEICQRGFDPAQNSFTQSYGRPELDASLLLLPLVGFLAASDPRVAGTVAAIERGLIQHGLVRRYRTDEGDHTGQSPVDGLPPGEGVFLPCSFWLVDNYLLLGRHAEARRLFERLIGLRNDLGLLSEQYDPENQRMLGNFPQAFTHLALVNSAFGLLREHEEATGGPASSRRRGGVVAEGQIA
jgi:GH15 family glucan-1,4-alpha-glucosidase